MNDSRDFNQQVNFFDFEFQLTVKSAKDPHAVFKRLTNGRFELDEEPDKELFAAIVLLSAGALMLFIAAYKSYRFCIKYN